MATVSVPQQEGVIRVSVDGDSPTVYPVTKGKVSVEGADLATFLTAVSGSAPVADKSGATPAAS